MVGKRVASFLGMLCFILVACNKDSEEIKESNDKIVNYELVVSDYQWIAKTNLANEAQLTNLAEINSFNQETTSLLSWTDSEITVALNALLFVHKNLEEGLTYNVSFDVSEAGGIITKSIELEVSEVSVNECATVACIDPIEAISLTEADYLMIVAMNKGTLDQLDNIGIFKTFNTDSNSPAYWESSAIEYALNALLLHHFNKEVGNEIEVTYEVFDGNEVLSLATSIEVFDTPPFDVRSYESKTPAKNNSIRLFAHYMPWYESKDHDGFWGIHWTMANQNPDIITDGKRQIASHYYPIIGPYGSSDQDLVDYHLLLMKYCGIDGVLIDWYGTYDVNDYQYNLDNSNALIDKTSVVGIDYAIVYEDRTTEKVVEVGAANTAIEAATADFRYIKSNYTTDANYIQAEGQDLLLTFTPVYINNSSDWVTITNNSNFSPTFLSIWEQSSDLGSVGSGEFSWVSNNTGDHIEKLTFFYENQYSTFDYAIGSAYPGFKDFYQQGGWGDGIGWEVAHNETSILNQTLGLATASNIDALQLVTWNDFGEGTMIEPTEEFGYTLLEEVQNFAGVDYTKEPLEMIFQYYILRKELIDDEIAQLKLDQVFQYLNSLQIARASDLINSI